MPSPRSTPRTSLSAGRRARRDHETRAPVGMDAARSASGARVPRRPRPRLQAEYVVARDAARDATASLTEEEFKEFRERVGR